MTKIEPCRICKSSSDVNIFTRTYRYGDGYVAKCLRCKKELIRITEAEAIEAWNEMQRKDSNE